MAPEVEPSEPPGEGETKPPQADRPPARPASPTPLEEATTYGMPSLRWPGSGSHDYFAAAKASAKKVSLYAIAVDACPQALEGSSEEFMARRTGKATFSFPTLDDELATELEAFLARLYEHYRAQHAGTGSS